MSQPKIIKLVKVVHPAAFGFESAWMYKHPKLRLTYEPYKWTIPIKGMPIAAFETLEDALFWASDLRIKSTSLFFECFGVKSKKQPKSFWSTSYEQTESDFISFWTSRWKTADFAPVPEGTIFCSRLKILEPVNYET